MAATLVTYGSVQGVTHYIPMSRALACLSCDAVFELGECWCPACGGEQFWPVARWLDRVGAPGAQEATA